MSHAKFVYRFGNGRAEGDKSMKALLGGKGANLAEMSAIGLPVPPGFTVTAEACRAYYEADAQWPDGLDEQVDDGIAHLEDALDQRLGDTDEPLLVSVRSGAAVSMPGMMDTVLNLGINDDVVQALARKTGNDRFAFDAYRRFIDMFGGVVMGVPHETFEHVLEGLKREHGVAEDTDLDADALHDVVERYKAVYRQHTGHMFPSDPHEQMRLAIDAVFESWNSTRAIKYRQINHITGLLGTAVTVQAMAYGNMGDTSGTGVCFTRNPSTGEKMLYGEYLINAQGEDVVAGIRTPQPIAKLQELMPEVFDQLVAHTETLEAHYHNMQDIEFTIQEGRLFFLQTRNGKRTGPAALRIAVDLVREGVIDEAIAVRDLVEPGHLDQLLHPGFADAGAYKDDVLGRGLAASPGAAVGRAVFTAEDAEDWHARGESVVLVRVETSPDDVGGMHAAEGILTSRGGITSHAAVVARGWGKPCVAGCGDIVINAQARSFTNGSHTIREGDWLSLNGTTGEVIAGKQDMVDPELSDEFATFMNWVDTLRTLKVRTNADTPEDAEQAIAFGAEGIGLCRTEHMFFEGNRIRAVREMIFADNQDAREAALAKLLPYQKSDFDGIFRAMDGKPVTIRLLDPPLHEFLPHEPEQQEQMAEAMGLTVEDIQAKVRALGEVNPMLGHRGCRLGITYPEITAMQARAILEAAVECARDGVDVQPEIMVPLIGSLAEFRHQKDVIEDVAEAVFDETGHHLTFLIGTMIEIPRAALRAHEIAAEAEFFSFGTNDLTQMTLGYSRDDVAKFLPYYIEHKILPDDPFQVLDQDGVGELLRFGVQRGRQRRPDLKMGICGEHGGEPSSVAFCYSLGMDYVSCSPFRVPIARLALAQAHLRASFAERTEDGA